MAKNKEKAGAGRTIVILLVVLLLLLTAGAYGYGVYYFSSHFLPGSMVNGFNCSYMASEDTEDLLNQRVGAYVLAVETMKNGQEAISAQDVGLSYVSTGIVKQLIKDQDRFTWFLAFNQDKNYDISESLSYNVELMGQAVDNLKCMQPENVVQPVDAQIQDTGDTFEIIPEVMGNALDRTKTEEVISAAMLRGKTSVNLENESCYRKPSVYSTDEQLKANCEKMNQLVKVIITYDFADRTETVDRTLIKNWFGYDEDGNVILDENLVRQYVADLGLKYDTMGQTRTFLTYDNRQVEIKGGDYGWVIDQDEEVKALIEAIESGKYDYIRANFPNGDMVGHTGNYEATIVSLEALDIQLARIIAAVDKAKGVALITADHGNSDEMCELDKKGNVKTNSDGTPKAKTSHTLNPVPFIIYDNFSGDAYSMKSGKFGLANVAATTVELLGYKAPSMWCESIIDLK